VRKLLLAALLLLIPIQATAADGEPRCDRPHWSLELKGGVFFPDVAHWSSFYGSSFMGEYGGALSYKVIRQLEVGVEGTYARATGKGQQLNHGLQAGKVSYEQAPVNVFLLGRAVFDENQLLVPYAGGGYTRMFFSEEVHGQGTTRGSTNGFHARAGVQVLMDRLEPESAENFYKDYGLHHTYFFVEGRYTHASADTVPTGSVNIGGASTMGGLLFEF